MTAEKSHTRTQYEIWIHHLGTGELVPTGILDDAAFAAHRYTAHVELGTRPILRTRTVTTIYSDWADAPHPDVVVPLDMPAPGEEDEAHRPALFDLDPAEDR